MLKKITAISFLIIFLFNVAGYYLVYIGWEYAAHHEMAKRLDDRSFDGEELTTIKLPYTLPYHAEDAVYKRVTGEFQHEGRFYKLVEQKIENDTLFVVCIKDNQQTKAHAFMTDMAKTSSDLPASSLKLLNSLVKEYMNGNGIVIVSSRDGWTATIQHFEIVLGLKSIVLPQPTPPPDFIA